MRTFIKIPLLLSCILLSINGFSQSDPIHQAINAYQADTLIKDYADSSNFILVDLRTPSEFASGYIDGAINVNYYADEFDTNLALLDKTKVYLIYCASGGRSGAAFNKMKALEFEVVYNMLGGITAWKNAGLPVVRSTGLELILSQNEVKIYPNPASGFFNIEFSNPELINSYFLVDIRGRELYKNSNLNGTSNIQINSSEWTSGLYFLQIVRKDGEVRQEKILIN